MLAKMFRYGLTTILNLSIDVTLGYFLVKILDYPAWLSLTISTAINTPLFYIFNEYFVFSHDRGSSISFDRFVRTLIIIAATFTLRQGLIFVLIRLGYSSKYGEYPVLLAAIGISFIFSFFMSNNWIFISEPGPRQRK